MLKRQSNLSPLYRRRFALAALVALASWLGRVGSPDIAFAESSYNDLSTAEGWAWSKISKGEWADFNLRCDPQAQQLDPKVDDARWQNDCRKITATFLQDLLTMTPFRESTPFTGVRIKGARIVTDPSNQKYLDLESAKLNRPIAIAGSRIETDINLMEAQTDSPIALNACLINRDFSAEGLRSTSELSITDDEIISANVNLNDARIDGNVDVWGTYLDGEFDATALHVKGTLDISSSANNKAWFKKVVKLDSAKIGGNVQMFGVVFDDALVASYLQVGGYLSMAQSAGQSTTFQQKVSVNGAKISGLVDMSDVRFGNELNADYLEVGSYLSMRKAHFAKAVNMAFAKIHGPLELNKTKFDNKLDAFQLQVGGYVSMQDAKFLGDVRFPFAKLENNLDLRNATVANLDLSGASIAGDLQLASQNAHANWKTGDGKDGDLNLRNAHIDNLMDEEQAWPKRGHLVLNGASFDHLGGHQGETERDMLKRGAEWWDEHWAKLNPQYSPSPYAQLAAAFTALGDRDSANEIRYRARESELEMASKETWGNGERQVAPDEPSGGNARTGGPFGTWLLLSVLKYVAGYGIGRHTFRVIYWVLGFSLVGAIILYFTVPEARVRYKNSDRLPG